ncbi:Retrotransposon gag protein [Cucumis melo var. makuwa]|nr:Retrotransposon gag protein [Cucumis melo var. makuwa]
MTLEGTMNPADVERRVNLVEKCFSVMERLEDKKVKLACCKTVSRILCGKSDMAIAEYEKKFRELGKYAISFIMDEEDKCKHFEEGLRTAI